MDKQDEMTEAQRLAEAIASIDRIASVLDGSDLSELVEIGLNAASHTMSTGPTLATANTCSTDSTIPETSQNGHSMLMLTSGPKLHLLPICHKHDIQTAMFGYGSVILDTLLPGGMSFPIEVGPATTECPECGELTPPVPMSDPSKGWITHPCCQFECSCCYKFGTVCSNCSKYVDEDNSDNSCCDCTFCGNCGDADDDLCSNCETCGDCCDCFACTYCGDKQSSYHAEYCSDCDKCLDCCNCDGCDCGECQDSTRSSIVPGWHQKGWNVPLPTRDIVAEFAQNYSKHINPAADMCDFYLTEYVQAVMPASVRHGRNNGLRAATLLLSEAIHHQDMRVSVLSDAFLEYGFMAIGGEIRHHPSVRDINPSHGRENMWAWWTDMGAKYGIVPMLEDALVLFEDQGAWNGGYGGKAWADCTRIVLMYAKGDLDRKTFVDRCFALEHNGGSFLNKIGWARIGLTSVSNMKRIGNAHAAETIGFGTLVQGATDDVRSMLRTLLTSFAWLVPNVQINDWTGSDRTNMRSALDQYAPIPRDDDESELPEEDTLSAVASGSYQTETVKSTSTAPKYNESLVAATKGYFMPDTTYVSKEGHTMTFGAGGLISDQTATWVSGIDGSQVMVGAGTDYPAFIVEENLYDWSIVPVSPANNEVAPFCGFQAIHGPAAQIGGYCGNSHPTAGYVCTGHFGHSETLHAAYWSAGDMCPVDPWASV